WAYVWGDALGVLEELAPDARIINLETSVTRSEDAWPGKGIHYRMHPPNVPCLTADGIDVCSLANNHVLDFGFAGLEETLAVLAAARIATTGAGHNDAEAWRPAIVERASGARILVFGLGTESSGIPRYWAAEPDRPGVNLLPDLSPETAVAVESRVRRAK